jgi:hypothetical protein
MPIRPSLVAAGLAALTLAGTIVRVRPRLALRPNRSKLLFGVDRPPPPLALLDKAADDKVFTTNSADPSYKRPVYVSRAAASALQARNSDADSDLVIRAAPALSHRCCQPSCLPASLASSRSSAGSVRRLLPPPGSTCR